MTDIKKLILKDLKNILAFRLKDNLNDLILFGSQLTESQNQGSDYDILIVLNKKVDWQTEREISDLCYQIELKYGIITDTHILSTDELDSARGKQPIFQNAISKGLHA
jgi:uncharacterized protein